jgi:hypothetical protein
MGLVDCAGLVFVRGRVVVGVGVVVVVVGVGWGSKAMVVCVVMMAGDYGGKVF